MLYRLAILAVGVGAVSNGAYAQTPQKPVTLRSAIVVLTDDPALRMQFENALAAKARTYEYDAVTTYDIEPDTGKLDSKKFAKALASQGIQAVLMLRPAAIGPGSSLDSVRDSVSPETYRSMQAFAKEVSPAGDSDLVAVVHMAIYVLDGGNAELISSGAVWLDEKVENQAQGVQRLEDLIVANVNKVRPAIRQHLGLPPLP